MHLTYKHLLITLGVFLIDVIYTFYLKSVSSNNILSACNWAAIVTLLNGIVIVNYSSDILSLFCAMLGAFAGTFVAMKYFRI